MSEKVSNEVRKLIKEWIDGMNEHMDKTDQKDGWKWASLGPTMADHTKKIGAYHLLPILDRMVDQIYEEVKGEDIAELMEEMGEVNDA